jgi:hypothetical protein
MLKIDHNPIEWPPEEVVRLNNPPEGGTAMEFWVLELKDWLRNHQEEDLSSHLVRDSNSLDLDPDAVDSVRSVGANTDLDVDLFVPIARTRKTIST